MDVRGERRPNLFIYETKCNESNVEKIEEEKEWPPRRFPEAGSFLDVFIRDINAAFDRVIFYDDLWFGLDVHIYFRL